MTINNSLFLNNIILYTLLGTYLQVVIRQTAVQVPTLEEWKKGHLVATPVTNKKEQKSSRQLIRNRVAKK